MLYLPIHALPERLMGFGKQTIYQGLIFSTFIAFYFQNVDDLVKKTVFNSNHTSYLSLEICMNFSTSGNTDLLLIYSALYFCLYSGYFLQNQTKS